MELRKYGLGCEFSRDDLDNDLDYMNALHRRLMGLKVRSTPMPNTLTDATITFHGSTLFCSGALILTNDEVQTLIQRPVHGTIDEQVQRLVSELAGRSDMVPALYDPIIVQTMLRPRTELREWDFTLVAVKRY